MTAFSLPLHLNRQSPSHCPVPMSRNRAPPQVTIAAPPNSRAFMLRGNLTTFRALAITFVGGDLSSSAQFFASK